MVAIDKNIVNLIRYLTIKDKRINTNHEYTNTYKCENNYIIYIQPNFSFNYRLCIARIDRLYAGIYNLNNYKKGWIRKVAELPKNY